MDDKGRSYSVLNEIVDHQTNGHAISKDDGFLNSKSTGVIFITIRNRRMHHLFFDWKFGFCCCSNNLKIGELGKGWNTTPPLAATASFTMWRRYRAGRLLIAQATFPSSCRCFCGCITDEQCGATDNVCFTRKFKQQPGFLSICCVRSAVRGLKQGFPVWPGTEWIVTGKNTFCSWLGQLGWLHTNIVTTSYAGLGNRHM